MLHTTHEFLTEWKEERDFTMKYLRVLENESLGIRAEPEGRSLGFLAWHIVLTMREMPGEAGLLVDAPEADAPQPATAAAIAGAYLQAAQAVAAAVEQEWTDEMLAGTVEMYGEQWTREMVLRGLITHQTHHRGQMSVLMRIAGLPVPGIYGPSREEWSAMGIAPHQ
jgi:uncharacterized damage-inducible protein DinB